MRADSARRKLRKIIGVVLPALPVILSALVLILAVSAQQNPSTVAMPDAPSESRRDSSNAPSADLGSAATPSQSPSN